MGDNIFRIEIHEASKPEADMVNEDLLADDMRPNGKEQLLLCLSGGKKEPSVNKTLVIRR